MSKPTHFTQEEVEAILNVVDRLTDVEVTLEMGDVKLHVRKGTAESVRSPEKLLDDSAHPGPRPPQRVASAMGPTRSSLEQIHPAGSVAIRAPMLGTFYRAPSPAEPPYVQLGTRVSAGDPVCIIEVMKLFNTINVPVSGKITSIAVDNGAMVEFNQLLFVLEPD
jgi:acetyl-CoA carboxylase biotin carboxyl carrier protein